MLKIVGQLIIRGGGFWFDLIQMVVIFFDQIQTVIDDDASQPKPKGHFARPLSDFLKRSDEGILHGVLGIVRVLQHAIGQVVNRRRKGVVHLPTGRLPSFEDLGLGDVVNGLVEIAQGFNVACDIPLRLSLGPKGRRITEIL